MYGICYLRVFDYVALSYALLGRPGRVKFILNGKLSVGECNSMTLPYLHRPHDSGPIQWARGGVGLKPSAAARPDGLRWTLRGKKNQRSYHSHTTTAW